MGRMRLNTETFIQKAQQIHGLKYNYSDTKYITSKNKIKIICNTHGPFYTLPNNHISNISGCPQCAILMSGTTQNNKTKNTFIADCAKIHNNKYDYSGTQYTKAHDIITINCPEHGQFMIKAYLHKQGQGCNLCGIQRRANKQKITKDEFIEKCQKIHNNKYDYSNLIYTTLVDKLHFNCPLHGQFIQKGSNHIKGYGCQICGNSAWFMNQGGYTESFFDNNPLWKEYESTLYIIHFSNNDESFIKIGITKDSVKYRYHSGYKSYKMKIIHTFSLPLYTAWKYEQSILERFNYFKYIPTGSFGGKYECLNDKINTNDILKFITTLL